MTTKRMDGVMCFWKYTPPKNPKEPYRKLWKLMESVQIDDDGYFLTNPKSFEAFNSRHPWEAWTSKKVYRNKDKEDYHYESIMGRAITIWYVESGVGLLNFNPPEWVPWVSISFLDELKKLPNWSSFLEDGHTLYLGTAREAKKHLYGE